MSKLVKLPINEATNKQLLYYAQRIVGLEVNKGTNSANIIAKIEEAMPGTTEIDVEAESESSADHAPPAPLASAVMATDESIPEGRAGAHFRYDPKVIVEVSHTSDKTRAKDVQVSVNGDVIIIKRGQKVSIPYRHYLALRDAIEKVGIETDEINPVTHMPKIEFVDRPSYEFSVIAMPSEEEVAAFHERTNAMATV